MIGASLNQRARAIRRVTVANITASLDETPSDYFPARLYPPDTPSARSDGSPRENSARSRLVWHHRAPAMGPADRVELAGAAGTWELLSTPEPHRLGERVEGYQAEVLELGELYPMSAEVEDAPSAEPVPLSVYAGSEQVSGHGDYEDYDAEAPIEFADTLDADNRVLLLDDKRWRVVSALVDFQIPHVRLRLRKIS